MKAPILLAISLVISANLMACNDQLDEQEEVTSSSVVTGRVTYRERIALKPGHTLTVTLNNLSELDDAVSVVAKTARPLTSSAPPFPFVLEVDRKELNADGRYNISASITDANNDLVWTANAPKAMNPALKEQDLGQLLLVPVISPRSEDIAAPVLVGGEWRVEDIAGRGIIDFSKVTMTFGENGSLSGFAGCNRYSADYRLDDSGLAIQPIALTRKACAPALMNQEQDFTSLLQDVETYRFTRERALVLTASDDREILARR